MEVWIENQNYQVLIEPKRIKNIYLRVKDSRTLLVSAHPSVPQSQIEQFILSKKEWIMKVTQRVENRQEIQKNKEVGRATIQYFGRVLPFHIVEAKYPALVEENNEVYLYVRKKDQTTMQKTFDNEAKKVIEQMCAELRHRYDRIMDDYRLPHPDISVRKMTSKWGSCIPTQAKITMNQNLIFMPLECIDYVLLHEFVHMIVPNHSKRFYDVVQYHMPNYKQMKALLREK